MFPVMDKKTDAGPPAAPASEGKTGRTIQSIERALDLLDILAAADGERALGEIAAKAGLNSSTCHHLLATLVKRGYVGRNPRTRSYFLGARITELSNRRLKQFNLIDTAMAELRQLNDATGESVQLAALRGYALVTLVKLDSRLPVRAGVAEGGKANAAHATAVGKAMLAWLPEPEITRIIAVHGLSRFTPNTVGTLAALIEELRLVRRNGYAVDNEEFQPGVFCVGAAIRDHAGAVMGAVSCSMPAMRANGEPLEAVKQAVKLCAAMISQRLVAA
jgi:IclR family transcriptional regulator, acetate operon repressor